MDDQHKKRSRGSDNDISGENVGTPHIRVKQAASCDGIADVFSHLDKEFIDRHRQDVKQVSHQVLRHRIGLNYSAVADNVSVEQVIDGIVNAVKTP